MKLRRNKKGFTIIELVIVIAVIGILAAVLIPTFVNLTNKANEAADNALVNNLNKALKMEEQEAGHQKAPTLEGAIKDLEDQGYILENLASKSGKDLLWSQSENQFLLNTEGKSGKDYWKIVDAVPAQDDQKYSYYAGKNFNQTDVTVKYGFDAGRIDNIGKVTYVGTGAAQEVAIRTNGGDFVVNAENDVVKHYGPAQDVTLTAVGSESYYENGPIEQVYIKKGRIVLTNEKDASVKTIYLQASGDTYDNIILATQLGAELPDVIARDTVPLPTGENSKKVVTIQTNVNKEGKAPERTETINLYSTKGQIGNDVYEANNGYDVSKLALLVVEASSNAAKERAADQISDPKVIEQITEIKTAVEVSTFNDLNTYLSAKAKYIVFKNDINATNVVAIENDVTLDGNGHKLITSEYVKQDARSINVGSATSPIDVTLRNLTIQGPRGSYSRGVNVLKAYVTLNIHNCEITAGHYPINVVTNGHHLTMNITESTISGYCALNIWAFYNEVSVSNSTLTGTNNSSGSSSNFATVCFESNTTFSDDTHSYNNKVAVKNSVINAIENSSCSQAIVGFNGGTIGAISCIFETKNCTFNSTHKVAYYDGGYGNSWINNGEEVLVNASADLSEVTIESDGYTASGTVKFVINGQTVSFNLQNAEKSSWSSGEYTGMDYVFKHNTDLLTVTLDLDICNYYPNGFALYLSTQFRN